MSCPFGETGWGKMGLRPPESHAAKVTMSAARPTIFISAFARCATRWKYIGGRNRGRNRARAAASTAERIESKIDCGRSQKASLRRRDQPEPVGRMSQVRPDHAALHRPVPQLWLQALALERDGLGGVQGLARGRPCQGRSLAL